MGRPARANFEEIARACAKLEAEGRLTVHTLRQALGGGGSDMLMRGLRQWRQQQREEARVPLEKMVSKGLQAAWACELQRVREEAALEVHAMYADDKAHLDFCMSEMQRLEKEVDRLEEAAVASKAADDRAQSQAAAALKEATDRATEHECRTDGLASRFEDLQRVDNEKSAEIALARQQRERDAQNLCEERAICASVQQAHQASLVAQATQASESARLEERCSQQQETLRYMRADIEAKIRDVEALRTQILGLETELRSTRDVAVRAEAFLTTRQRSTKAYYFDTKLGGLAKPVSPQPRKT